MNVDTKQWARVVDTLDALQREVARLGERLAALESRGAPPAPAATIAPPAPAPAPTAAAEVLPEDIVIAIGAAIAAYLGVKPRIRQIRVLRSAGWAQQGRITIQASHALARSER